MAETWVTQDAPLRWLVPANTSTWKPRLQQVWVCLETGAREWRDVPIVSEEMFGNQLSPVPPITAELQKLGQD